MGGLPRAKSAKGTKKTGADSVRWNLSDLYLDIDDPVIDVDIKEFQRRAEEFSKNYQGQLKEKLGAALTDKAALGAIAEKLMVYLYLRKSTDATNADIERKIAQVGEAWARVEADHLVFFEHELVAIDDDIYEKILASDDNARRHRSLLDHVRANKKYLLAEPIERALTLRDPFGPSEWSDYVDECEAELAFEFDGKKLTLPAMLHVVNNHNESSERARGLKTLADGLTAQRFDRIMARALNASLGAKVIEDRERGYENPMSSRNIGNRIDDATVEALHDAVADIGAKQCRRYYRLLAAHLKKKTLRWSDRNAAPPFADSRTIPWTDCIDTVKSAYGTFSPTLQGLIARMLDRGWVDAPPSAGKTGGAYNYSVRLPNGEARAYNFLNYLGSTRDVMTVAHEFGHGVHGILAADAQGSLMFRAPMAYAETASIFGEMTTFQYLIERTEDDEARLALLMEKAADHLNTVVRQISFSNFERKVHEARKQGKLTADDFSKAWLEVTHAFYGAPGDLFTYENIDNLWCYVSHFLRPFYVYAYAFGELFTQSLFAVREQFGDKFESMYLDLLRAGGSKDAVALMKPFGLDPRSPTFWKDGITGSISTWLDQAEELSARMGVKVPAARG